MTEEYSDPHNPPPDPPPPQAGPAPAEPGPAAPEPETSPVDPEARQPSPPAQPPPGPPPMPVAPAGIHYTQDPYAGYPPYAAYPPYDPYAYGPGPAWGEPLVLIPMPPRPFYGGWATFGLGLAALGVSMVGQAVVLVVAILREFGGRPGTPSQQQLLRALLNGTAVSLSAILGAILGIVFLWLMVRVKRGATFRLHLGLAGTTWLAFLACMGVYVLYVGGMIGLSSLVKPDPEGVDMMRKIYASTQFKPLVWAALCLAAPAFEELLFRGFMLAGLRNSLVGPVGAVVLTSLLWAVIHLQYGWAGKGILFVLGLLLGGMTVKTRSILPAVVVHAINNVLATAEMAYGIGQGGT